MNPNQPMYSPSYGPQTTHAGNQSVQGGSRDGIQPSAFPITPIRPPANPLNYPTVNFAQAINNQLGPDFPPPPIPTYSNNNHKRQHSLEGWETGSSPTRRRVSLGNINSSSQPSPATMPSGHPSPAAAPTIKVPPGNNDDVFNMLLVPDLHSDTKDGVMCIYQCPNTGRPCNTRVRGRDKRNRFRHLATHAQSEEECVADGYLRREDTLVLTRLSKIAVTCVLPNCDFRKEVWRTDKVRELHEKEAHPDLWERRKQKKNRAKENW